MTERDWERLYLAAVMETDWLRIEERIEAVESAISQRLQEIPASGTPEEEEALAKASAALANLRKDVANWKLKQS